MVASYMWCVEDKYLNKGHLYKSQNAKMREFQIVASDTLDWNLPISIMEFLGIIYTLRVLLKTLGLVLGHVINSCW